MERKNYENYETHFNLNCLETMYNISAFLIISVFTSYIFPLLFIICSFYFISLISISISSLYIWHSYN